MWQPPGWTVMTSWYMVTGSSQLEGLILLALDMPCEWGL